MNSPTHPSALAAPAPAPDPAHTQAPAPTGSKTLWAATLVLVVVVLAMGATLIRIQSQPVEPRMAVLPQPVPAANDTTHDGATRASTVDTGTTPEAPSATSAATSADAGAAVATSAVAASPNFLEQNRPQALIDKAQAAIKNEAIQAIEITATPRPVLPRQPEPAVLRPPGVGASHTATPESR